MVKTPKIRSKKSHTFSPEDGIFNLQIALPLFLT